MSGSYLQAGAVLAKGRLDLQLLLDGGVGSGGAVAFHLGGRPEGALEAPRRVLHLLQLPLQAVKLRLSLQRNPTHAHLSRSPRVHRKIQQVELLSQSGGRRGTD